MAAIGQEGLPGRGRPEAQLAVRARLADRLADGGAGRREAERHDLDRQREAPEPLDALSPVGDDDHAPARRGDDLLAQERPAAALDQAQLVVELVGAVDGEVELRDLVERRERHAFALGLIPRRLGGRNRDDREAGPHPRGQQRDERGCRRAGAEPELHAVAHEPDGALGGGALEGVGAHGSGRMAGGSSGFIPASYSRAPGGGSYCGRVVPGPGACGRPGPGAVSGARGAAAPASADGPVWGVQTTFSSST